MNSMITTVIDETLPMIIVSIVIVSSLRICYLYKNNIHFTLYKELFYLITIIYVLALFQIVTNEDTVSWSSNNFIPFREIFRYKIGSRLFVKNVVGNILMFLPFGFLASYILKSEDCKEPAILAFLASLTIECVQMMIGRVFDIDDIILNTLGGLIGFYIYRLLKLIKDKLPDIFKNELILDAIAIIIVLLVLSALI